jgi:hypothetical protein
MSGNICRMILLSCWYSETWDSYWKWCSTGIQITPTITFRIIYVNAETILQAVDYWNTNVSFYVNPHNGVLYYTIMHVKVCCRRRCCYRRRRRRRRRCCCYWTVGNILQMVLTSHISMLRVISLISLFRSFLHAQKPFSQYANSLFCRQFCNLPFLRLVAPR